jgi:hypothetical protein
VGGVSSQAAGQHVPPIAQIIWRCVSVELSGDAGDVSAGMGEADVLARAAALAGPARG